MAQQRTQIFNVCNMFKHLRPPLVARRFLRVQTLHFPSFPALPDILALIFSYTTVPTTLICEKISFAWLSISRKTHVIEVWKPKLALAFPPKFLPTPYGHENYRDVCCLWYAWSKPWQVELGSEVKVALELKEGEAIPRKSGKVVRDLAGLLVKESRDRNYLGVRPNGTALVLNYSRFKAICLFSNGQSTQPSRRPLYSRWSCTTDMIPDPEASSHHSNLTFFLEPSFTHRSENSWCRFLHWSHSNQSTWSTQCRWTNHTYARNFPLNPDLATE
ncbi:hypothetical protein HDV00_008529 [Rhizophlyctis rosea]|nr:hypothetical protein HDV00_008529 [Rhizophlyctis rosea]